MHICTHVKERCAIAHDSMVLNMGSKLHSNDIVNINGAWKHNNRQIIAYLTFGGNRMMNRRGRKCTLPRK